MVAEFASALLCSDLEISCTPRADHAAYLSSWLTALKDDEYVFSRACTKAEEAVSYLHGLAGFTPIEAEPAAQTIAA